MLSPDIPSVEQVASMSPEDRARHAAAYLTGLEPGRQPLELFIELARLTVMSTVEVVPLRTNNQTRSTEVLLTRRPADDLWWGGQWHIAGTAILDNDLGQEHGSFGYDRVITRLYDGELGDAVEIIGAPRLFDAHLRRGARGPEQTVFLWAQVEQRTDHILPDNAAFFDARQAALSPPEGGLIIGHGATVLKASLAYENHQSTVARQT